MPIRIYSSTTSFFHWELLERHSNHRDYKNGTEVEITWASRPNRIYKVERSESLENDSVDSNRDGEIGFWEEVDDGILSEGEETTFADEIFDDSKKVFWRVTDMGPAE